ncbi:MAG: hypothetical protein WC271_12535 [Bacteroidales bacterium]|jgi:hypothetical protein|nr:hypothetical protein [Bacteroidales bacterium]NCU36858.1 hypothetical protein [Candidatus Falkowbacteria bacterium]MDD2631646.1 hypothetical protein [Bacteroidales bacterium]MDD3132807.1 hypothetical protein [Bacteroidales bacterium]MDD3526334.1 hypothetical protein [Bacteroidales bacterium]
MKKISILTFAILLSSVTAMAQYDFAIGLRTGGTSGLTLKKMNPSSAIEGIVGFWYHGLSVTVLWEKHVPAFNEPGFNWYYGGGGHVSFYGDDFDGRGPSWYDHYYDEDGGDLGLGIDGIVGLEYKIPNVPIAFSLDLKPFIEINTEGGVHFSPDPGLGIKVAF